MGVGAQIGVLWATKVRSSIPRPTGVRSLQTVSLLVAAAVLTWTASTQAYVDPGSGSMLVQLLLGGAAGLVVAVRVYWRRIVSRFRSGSRKSGDPGKQ